MSCKYNLASRELLAQAIQSYLLSRPKDANALTSTLILHILIVILSIASDCLSELYESLL